MSPQRPPAGPASSASASASSTLSRPLSLAQQLGRDLQSSYCARRASAVDTDLVLYSRQGTSVQVHQCIFAMYSPHLRRILASTRCCPASSSSAGAGVVEMFLPDVDERLLAAVVRFFYTGRLEYLAKDRDALHNLLYKALGMSPSLPVRTTEVLQPRYPCLFGDRCAAAVPTPPKFRAHELLDHAQEDISDHIEACGDSLIPQGCRVTCLVCSADIDYEVEGGGDPDRQLRAVERHYLGHRDGLKEHIFRLTGYRVDGHGAAQKQKAPAPNPGVAATPTRPAEVQRRPSVEGHPSAIPSILASIPLSSSTSIHPLPSPSKFASTPSRAGKRTLVDNDDENHPNRAKQVRQEHRPNLATQRHRPSTDSSLPPPQRSSYSSPPPSPLHGKVKRKRKKKDFKRISTVFITSSSGTESGDDAGDVAVRNGCNRRSPGLPKKRRRLPGAEAAEAAPAAARSSDDQKVHAAAAPASSSPAVAAPAAAPARCKQQEVGSVVIPVQMAPAAATSAAAKAIMTPAAAAASPAVAPAAVPVEPAASAPVPVVPAVAPLVSAVAAATAPPPPAAAPAAPTSTSAASPTTSLQNGSGAKVYECSECGAKVNPRRLNFHALNHKHGWWTQSKDFRPAKVEKNLFLCPRPGCDMKKTRKRLIMHLGLGHKEFEQQLRKRNLTVKDLYEPQGLLPGREIYEDDYDDDDGGDDDGEEDDGKEEDESGAKQAVEEGEEEMTLEQEERLLGIISANETEEEEEVAAAPPVPSSRAPPSDGSSLNTPPCASPTPDPGASLLAPGVLGDDDNDDIDPDAETDCELDDN